MLNVFQRENVTNVVCVVTRYFGGILLGAGGLTRAYSRSARDALAAAGAAEMGLWATADIPCPYALFERVRGEVTALGGTVDEAEYGAGISRPCATSSRDTACRFSHAPCAHAKYTVGRQHSTQRRGLPARQ